MRKEIPLREEKMSTIKDKKGSRRFDLRWRYNSICKMHSHQPKHKDCEYRRLSEIRGVPIQLLQERTYKHALSLAEECSSEYA